MIFSWNVTIWFIFQHRNLYGSQTSSINVVELGSHWSKTSSTADMTSSYELSSMCGEGDSFGVTYSTDVKSAGFQSQLEASRLSSHTEEL